MPESHQKQPINPSTKPSKAASGAVPEIVQVGHPALHSQSEPVPVHEITSPRIKEVMEQMTLALESQDDGVGLAAPQIGIPLQIFMVAGFVFDRIKKSAEKADARSGKKPMSAEALDAQQAEDLEDADEEAEQTPATSQSPHQFFINPVITKESKEKKWMEGEGCLSVRWLYGKVKRSTKVSLKSYNEKGQLSERGASGLLAHIFQHEVDHLNGILFTDKAKDLEEYDPEEIKRNAREAKQERTQRKKTAK